MANSAVTDLKAIGDLRQRLALDEDRPEGLISAVPSVARPEKERLVAARQPFQQARASARAFERLEKLRLPMSEQIEFARERAASQAMYGEQVETIGRGQRERDLEARFRGRGFLPDRPLDVAAATGAIGEAGLAGSTARYAGLTATDSFQRAEAQRRQLEASRDRAEAVARGGRAGQQMDWGSCAARSVNSAAKWAIGRADMPTR